jgi:arylsulfatase A-like enzyme
MKGDAWEGGHRMPFVARWPERVEAGAVSDQTICFTDVMATFADLVGIALPTGAGEDSRSFAKVLLGEASTSAREVTILKADGSVVRQGNWKLITHLGSGGFSKPRRREPEPGGPTGQLYDLERDLGETTNLWAARPDVVARLRALREEELAAGGDGRATGGRRRN